MYADKDRKNDFEWFLSKYDAIYKEHGECYVAIKNKNILGYYNSLIEGLKKTNEPKGSFIVQYCNGKEDGYTNYIASTNFMMRELV